MMLNGNVFLYRWVQVSNCWNRIMYGANRPVYEIAAASLVLNAHTVFHSEIIAAISAKVCELFEKYYINKRIYTVAPSCFVVSGIQILHREKLSKDAKPSSRDKERKANLDTRTKDYQIAR